MAMKTPLIIAGSALAVAQGLTMILTQTMTALNLGVATPFRVLGGCVAYVLELRPVPSFHDRRRRGHPPEACGHPPLRRPWPRAATADENQAAQLGCPWRSWQLR
jgi:hypothetical protein